ncbi:hypothetical protein HBH99_197720 [Parastagonospora nodorum]|nr:hypothetical protein HBH99_197720 [Parastagonospora nodorum]
MRSQRGGVQQGSGWAPSQVGAQRRHHWRASPQFAAHLSCSKVRWYPSRAPARAVLFYGDLRPRALSQAILALGVPKKAAAATRSRISLSQASPQVPVYWSGPPPLPAAPAFALLSGITLDI